MSLRLPSAQPTIVVVVVGVDVELLFRRQQTSWKSERETENVWKSTAKILQFLISTKHTTTTTASTWYPTYVRRASETVRGSETHIPINAIDFYCMRLNKERNEFAECTSQNGKMPLRERLRKCKTMKYVAEAAASNENTSDSSFCK